MLSKINKMTIYSVNSCASTKDYTALLLAFHGIFIIESYKNPQFPWVIYVP